MKSGIGTRVLVFMLVRCSEPAICISRFYVRGVEHKQDMTIKVLKENLEVCSKNNLILEGNGSDKEAHLNAICEAKCIPYIYHQNKQYMYKF